MKKIYLPLLISGVFLFSGCAEMQTISNQLPGILTQQTGGINIIDLANIYSCAFLELKDLGKVYSNGNFEVLGRFDSSDIRGCNLLVAE